MVCDTLLYFFIVHKVVLLHVRFLLLIQLGLLKVLHPSFQIGVIVDSLSDLLLQALGGVDEVIEGHVPLFCHLYEGSQLGGDLLVLAGPLPVLLQLCLKTKQLRLEVCDADLLLQVLAVFLCVYARLTPPRVGGGLGYGRWQGRSGGEYGKVVQEVRGRVGGKEIRRRVVIAADWIRTF